MPAIGVGETAMKIRLSRNRKKSGKIAVSEIMIVVLVGSILAHGMWSPGSGIASAKNSQATWAGLRLVVAAPRPGATS
jgi:hypothetical protein